MQITNISDAKASLSFLIKKVQETNEPIIIGKAGKPVAILTAFRENTAPRKFGGRWKGKVKVDQVSKTSAKLENSFYTTDIFPEQNSKP